MSRKEIYLVSTCSVAFRRERKHVQYHEDTVSVAGRLVQRIPFGSNIKE